MPDSSSDPLAAVARDHGPWTAESLWLGGDVFTNGPGVLPAAHRQRQLLQTAAECCRKPIGELRILDLGALEGVAALEFARHGARVVALEGREGNAAKIRAAADVARMPVEVVVADVRRLPELDLGTFDLVLCLGLLYHLDWPSIPPLLRALRAAAGDALILDTHVAERAETIFEHDGKTYGGIRYSEYPSPETMADFERHPWSAIGNAESAWLTRAALANLLADCGFASVSECLHPWVWQGPGRSIFVAQTLLGPAVRSLPPGVVLPDARRPDPVTGPDPR